MQEFQQECIGRHEEETLLRKWFAGFYRVVLAYRDGETAHIIDLMHDTATTDDDDFDISKRRFLGKFWHAEFFLARHEADLL